VPYHVPAAWSGAGPVPAPATEPIPTEAPSSDDADLRSPESDADRVRALEIEVSQLRTAMASRAGIEQAKGILMLLTSCGEQVAFDLLTHISSHTHRKVRDVAQAITDSAAGRTPLPDEVASILRDACPPARPVS
jgi:hypothetical protein